MPRTFFKVSIGHCAADLQPLSKSTTVDPYLRINFAGDYKKFSTAVRKKSTQRRVARMCASLFLSVPAQLSSPTGATSTQTSFVSAGPADRQTHFVLCQTTRPLRIA
jgi:hypothetical protein